MHLPRRCAVLCLPALLAFPAAASAEPFKDRVITGVHGARVAGPGRRRRATRPATARSIAVKLASSYTGDPAVAQTYATFLGTLPHGAELASLKVTVVPSAEIASECGGEPSDGILACYGASDQTMIVPGDQAAGQRRLGQLRDRPRVRSPHRRPPLQRAAGGARLRPQALVVLRAGVLEHDRRQARARATRASTTSPTRARRGPSPTRG